MQLTEKMPAIDISFDLFNPVQGRGYCETVECESVHIYITTTAPSFSWIHYRARNWKVQAKLWPAKQIQRH